MKPLSLLVAFLMIFIGFILIALGCTFGYTSMRVYFGKPDELFQLITNEVFTLIFLAIGGFLFYKGVKRFKKKINNLAPMICMMIVFRNHNHTKKMNKLPLL